MRLRTKALFTVATVMLVTASTGGAAIAAPIHAATAGRDSVTLSTASRGEAASDTPYWVVEGTYPPTLIGGDDCYATAKFWNAKPGVLAVECLLASDEYQLLVEF